MADNGADVKVWDPFVRISHWAIAVGFFVAYLVEDDIIIVHTWAGYVVGSLVLLRIVWGFVGPRHTRFADFVTGPVTALRYLVDLILGHPRRYIGHSPAGGAMVIALLASLVGTVASGLIVYAEEHGAGPLAPLYATSDGDRSQVVVRTDDDREPAKERKRRRKSAFEEVHEVVANLTLILVIAHVLGVLLASFVHRENLARAMVTGRKRAE